VAKIISKHCEWGKLCRINRSGPVFLRHSVDCGTNWTNLQVTEQSQCCGSSCQFAETRPTQCIEPVSTTVQRSKCRQTRESILCFALLVYNDR